MAMQATGTEAIDNVKPDAPQDAPARHRATRPREFDLRAKWRVAKRVFNTVGRENFALIAAGCAFYGLLAMAPTLAAVAALYGLISDPNAMQSHLSMLEEIVPPAAYDLIRDQASALETSGNQTLGWTSIGAALFAVWTSRAGVRALMTGVTIAYREREGRSILMEQVAIYMLTLMLVIAAAITLGVIVIAPAILALLPLGDVVQTVATWIRWPIALVAVMLGLGALYRFGPPRRRAKKTWISPGAITAVCLWLAGSVGFTVYVNNFGNYNETYGALGAVVALLMWFWLSALSALIGAVVNAELELETAVDTTVGPDRPMGQRGAHVANNVAD